MIGKGSQNNGDVFKNSIEQAVRYPDFTRDIHQKYFTSREQNSGYQGMVGRMMMKLMFKGTNLQKVVTKQQRSDAQYNEHRQYCTVII